MLATDAVSIRQTNDANESLSLSSRVYEYLSDLLIRGELRYGDRLNIKQIAEHLNMSPMPIRDAIKRLEQEHIVVVNPRSHCHVRIPSKQEILDAVDARRMIEHFAVSLVINNVRLSELTTLDGIIERMREYAEDTNSIDDPDEMHEYIELDRQFHSELCALSGNSYVAHFYKTVNMYLSMSFRYGIGVCHGISATFSEHCDIINGLKAHSPKALDVLDAHLIHSRHNIINEESFRSLPD